MALTITCKCGKALKVQETSLGKKVRCPGCQEIIVAKAPDEKEEEFEEEDSYEDDRDDDDDDRRPAKKKSDRRCHEIDYEIIGDDMQLVEVELDPGEVVIAEAGAMTYMEEGIDFTAKLGDGSEPNQGFFKKLWGATKRSLGGESMFLTHFTNNGRGKRRVAFGAPYPGKILAMDLDGMDGEIICQKSAFLCAALGTKIGITFQKKFGAGLFGGEGFILQKLEGDGWAFVHACGAIIKKDLEDGEKLRVDTGSFVAMTRDVEYDIQKAGNLKSMFFGGEGLFLVTLTGPGQIWLQSLPFSRLAERIVGATGITKGGGGSILGKVLGAVGDG